MHSLIVFASGAGSNTKAIIDYYKRNNKARVTLIVCNNPDAGVLEIAKKEDIPFLMVTKKTIKETLLIEQLNDYNPTLIVLAGFLWKLPAKLVNAFPNKIINIHPALLPKHGGKGMYGMNVHNAVITSHDDESGITIHYVNEQYDKGNIILQARCKVGIESTAQTLATEVHKLEHFYFPRTIEFLLSEK